jgi:GNAT superfamily N-acetyltransferase
LPLNPLPPGHVGAVVTSLEMTQPPTDEPPPPSGLHLERWEDVDLHRYRVLFRRVGAPWLWYSRLVMSDAELRAALGEVHAVLDRSGAEVGLIELEPGLHTCRIRFLGLVPELTGRGHGRWLVGEALRLAWREGVERVDLYTCSLDHPAAMPAYLRAGFVATGRSFESFPDPRLAGLLPRDCAPQVPLVEPS